MKINKSNYTLVLMCGDIYEGTFQVTYNDKMFGKEIEIEDTAYINEEVRKLTDNEKLIVNQIDKAIKKETDNKGLVVEKWSIHYYKDGGNIGGNIDIEYMFGESMNVISFSLIDEQFIPKKALTLARTISKRLLKELK